MARALLEIRSPVPGGDRAPVLERARRRQLALGALPVANWVFAPPDAAGPIVHYVESTERARLDAARALLALTGDEQVVLLEHLEL